MITTSIPSKGVLTDVHESRHNPEFARDSVNGRFTSVDMSGTWKTINDFKEVLADLNIFILKELLYENDTYIIGIDGVPNVIRIYMIGADGTKKITWNRSNDFGWSPATILNGYVYKNINSSVINLFLTDGISSPKVIDINSGTSSSLSLNELNLTPKSGFVFMSLQSIITNGSLICGTYYYAIKAYKETGLSTDWYMMSSGVIVPNKAVISYTPESYHQITGGPLSLNSKISVRLKVDSYSRFNSTDGWRYKVAAFLVLDDYTIDTGKVFYDGIASEYIIHSQNKSYEDVDLKTISSSTMTVLRCGDMVYNGQIGVISDVTSEVYENGTYFDNIKFKNSIAAYGAIPKISIKLATENSSTNGDVGIYLDGIADSRISEWLSASTKFKQAQTSQSLLALINKNMFPAEKLNYIGKNGTRYGTPLSSSEGFGDFSNPIVDHHFKAYRIGEEVRVSMLPFDLAGKPLRPIFISDLKGFSEGNSVECNLASLYDESTSTATRRTSNGHFFTKRASASLELLAEINYLEIGNIIMDDFYDSVNNTPKISGFAILHGYPSKDRIVLEGIATRILKPTSNRKAILPLCDDTSQKHTTRQGGGWLIIYSPDLAYGDAKIEVGQTLFMTHKTASASYSSIRNTENKPNDYITKLYEKRNSSTSSVNGIIEKVYELPYALEVESIDVDVLGTIINKGRTSTSEIEDKNRPYGPKKSYLVKVEAGSGIYNLINSETTGGSIDMFTVRVENNVFGFTDTSDASLENTIYKYCGHFQKTDNAFFERCYDATSGHHLAKIAVYGGHYRSAVWDFVRIHKANMTNGSDTHCIYFPVLTKFNFRMRSGLRHAKDRSLSNGNEEGIGIGNVGGVDRSNLETYLLSKSYFSADDGREVYPTGMNMDIISYFKDMVFWTNKLNVQDKGETLRNYFISQAKKADGVSGAITGLYFIQNSLYVLQVFGVGYFPYEEKTMFQPVIGENIVMSYNEAFSRYENVTRTKGLQKKALSSVYENILYFYNELEGSLYIVMGSQIKNLSIEKGVQSLITKEFRLPTKLITGTINGLSYLYLQQEEKFFEYCISKDTVNGYLKINVLLFPSVLAVNFGQLLGLATFNNDSKKSRILVESPDGAERVYTDTSLTVILGAEKQDMKTFDRIMIDSDNDMLPERVHMKTGKREATEVLNTGFNILVHGPKVTMNTPYAIVIGDRFYDRMRDYMTMAVKLSSENSFIVLQVSSDYRNNI